MSAEQNLAERSTRGASHRFESLDALRGVAATCVVIYHTILLNHLEVPPWSTPVLYRLGLAVPLFYVLSAFSLAVGYYGKIDSPGAFIRYATRRAFRIAPLFYVLLPVWATIMALKFHQYPTPFVIFANLTFAFGLVPGVHESMVWAGWSIGVEVLFYVILPLLFWLGRGLRSSLALYAASLVLAIAFQRWIGAGTSYAHMNLITHLPHFLSGLVAFHLYRSGLLARLGGYRRMLLAGVAVWPLMAVFKLSHLTVLGVDAEQYLIALAFPCILLSQLDGPSKLLVNGASLFAGKRSFSVYLLHPLVVLATQPLVQALDAAHGATVAAVAGFAIVMALTTLAAMLGYRLIERPGMRLGGFVAERLSAPWITPAEAH